MTTRILPPEEWATALPRTELADAAPHLDPNHARIIVAEQDGQIVGHVVVLIAPHAEFLWIDPAYRRRASVFRRMHACLFSLLRAERWPTVLGAAMSDEMRALLPRLGFVALPGDHYVKTIQGEMSCLQQ